MTAEVELLPLPKGNVAHLIAAQAAEIEALRAEVDALREALAGLITWIPSADTYRRLGFDPEAPMRALEEARAALAKENSND